MSIASSACLVRVARSPADLESLACEWQALAAHAVEPNPFYEPWFLLPALAAGGEPRLECILVRIGGVLAGLFPFTRLAGYKGLPIGTLSSWRHNSSLLCTPLLHSAFADDCLDALLAWMSKDARSVSAAEFRYLPADGAFCGALANALRRARSMVLATESFARPLLRKDADAERYLRSVLSRESRKALRRKEKRLQGLGQVTRVALRRDEPAKPWIEQFLALEASGWKGRAGSALACTPAGNAFATRMLEQAHRRGLLQIHGIDCDGRPVARCINLLAGKSAYAYRTAYDETYGDYSPGVLAELDSIREFHALPDAELMDSITDPGNALMNRLWKHRRTMRSLVVGTSAWGDLWISTLPLLRWARSRVCPERTELTERG
jgi:CelD/BcsL family acetyltransferase involved in cellulose biosynthesis